MVGRTKPGLLAFLAVALTALAPAARAGTPVTEAVRLDTPSGRIHGTLLLPSQPGPLPVALIVSGSGPTDRDGNSTLLPGRNDSLKLLAEGLATRGIASLRYDKRGVGASARAGPREFDLRFESYVEDAVRWLQRLRADPRFSTAVVVGHSEGSLVGMRAAASGAAAGVVSIAGIARSPAQVVRDQLRPQLPADLWQASERILAKLEAGQTDDSVPEVLMALYRPSVQPYLISWFRHSPAREAAQLRVPLLLVHGTADIQVGVQEAHALHAAQPQARLLVIEGMNHVLKAVPADPARQQASYSDPGLPVMPELVERIAGFVRWVAGRE